ncbi:MAG TPA: hypothetical protein VFV50_10755 [Bdellovibrionales bacterium]|nr:hypothetical protein [Bdellovibrionales bacterium]
MCRLFTKIMLALAMLLAIQIAAVESSADHHAPHLGADVNICPRPLLDEVGQYGKGRIEVIKEWVAKSPHKHPNCVDSHQGHSMLSYLASGHMNETMLKVLYELRPDVNFHNKINLSSLVAPTVTMKGDTAMMTAADNPYIASDTMIFYLLAYGANPDLQEDVTGETTMIMVSEPGNHFNVVDPKGQYESSTEYRKLMFLRLFGADPNIQGWTQNKAPWKGNYAFTAFHQLAYNRTGVDILSPFKLLIEPETVLTWEHFWAQIPKSYTHKHVQLTRQQFEAMKTRMPKFNPRTLCLKDGSGRNVFEVLKTSHSGWNKQPLIEYLSRFTTCSE